MLTSSLKCLLQQKETDSKQVPPNNKAALYLVVKGDLQSVCSRDIACALPEERQRTSLKRLPYPEGHITPDEAQTLR